MKRFGWLLVSGIAAACWALYLVLVQLQADLTPTIVFRPSWLWVLVPLAVALIALALLSLRRRTRNSGSEVPQRTDSTPNMASTHQNEALVAGITEHGRLRAIFSPAEPRHHDVVWIETGAEGGRLDPGVGGRWTVTDEHGTKLGEASSVSMALSMLDLAALGWSFETTSEVTAVQPGETTIVDPARAALGRRPELLGVEFLTPNIGGPFAGQRYRTEAWQLTNGDRAVIVSDNAGTSLMNMSEHIAEAVDARWGGRGRAPIIIEEWDPPTVMGHRFVLSDRQGGHTRVDFDELDRAGIVLPRT